jgi:hypothetical protein
MFSFCFKVQSLLNAFDYKKEDFTIKVGNKTSSFHAKNRKVFHYGVKVHLKTEV